MKIFCLILTCFYPLVACHQLSMPLAIVRFFSYSLEGRIIPRHKVLVENHINIKLRYMLANSDEEFHKMVKDLIGKRKRFESAVTNEGTTHLQSVVTEDISTPLA